MIKLSANLGRGGLRRFGKEESRQGLQQRSRQAQRVPGALLRMQTGPSGASGCHLKPAAHAEGRQRLKEEAGHSRGVGGRVPKQRELVSLYPPARA